jgi:hypothetical protein
MEDQLWLGYVQKRRRADTLIDRMYGGFVSANLETGLLSKKLYDNLRRFGAANKPR